MKRLLPIWLCGAVVLLPSPAPAQGERFELGRRLRTFEEVWQEQTDPAARRRAVPPLQQATRTFLFKFGDARLREVGHDLDRARFALRSAEQPSPEVVWAESLSIGHAGCLVDTTATEVPITLAPFYKVEVERPKTARLRVTLWTGAGKLVGEGLETAIDKLPRQVRVPLKNIAEGDYTLRAEVLVNGKVLVKREQLLSCAARLAQRLEALQKAAADWPNPSDTHRETVRGLARLLGRLAQTEHMETNHPASRLLAEAESVLQAIGKGESFYGPKKAGHFWLWLPVNKRGLGARLAVPEAAVKGKPLPLVIVIHGTGGSENIFFEAHGPGKLVRGCQERGWLLVAPQSSFLGAPPLPELIAEVAKLYPVDKERVFLIGHSIGATHALNAAQAAPKAYAGVAGLAPGPTGGKDLARLKGMPIFIRVGSEDFLAPAARALHQELEKAGVAVDYHVCPGVEHLAIVVESLDEALKFFAKAAKR